MNGINLIHGTLCYSSPQPEEKYILRSSFALYLTYSRHYKTKPSLSDPFHSHFEKKKKKNYKSPHCIWHHSTFSVIKLARHLTNGKAFKNNYTREMGMFPTLIRWREANLNGLSLCLTFSAGICVSQWVLHRLAWSHWETRCRIGLPKRLPISVEFHHRVGNHSPDSPGH